MQNVKRVTGFVRHGEPMVTVLTNRSIRVLPIKKFAMEVNKGVYRYEKQLASATKRVAN